ncbi:hypothetical protein C6P46_006198 [Rhodotorula mucilaginosa]|uniref:RING-type domain-containing protein n=1 Tax=Rhodotorula mucilaginosa TaxID=5537 RepID=A0A9P7B4C0_RHOMI|nr:hypothetical protein C6P46_006198 [Rhodotorula mucilaginosa]
MNSLEPAPHGSPTRGGTSLDNAWFLSSTPTSPPNAAGSATPLGKRDPLAAPLEPLASFDLAATQQLASPRIHTDSDSRSTSSQAGGRPCTPSPSIRTAQTGSSAAMTAEHEGAVGEAMMSLSPVQGDEVRTAEDKTRGATPPPFEFDPFEEEAVRANDDELLDSSPTPPLGPFSTTVPIQRTFRSRYASSSTDSLPLNDDIFTESPSQLHAPALAHKRSHSHVAPSTGYTPPASYDESEDIGMYSPPSMPLDVGLSAIDTQPIEEDERLERPGARWRHSFSYEAQRAAPTTSTSTISATVHAAPSTGTSTSTQHTPPYVGLLRRRARQSSSSDQGERIATTAPPPSQTERGQSKRRRSGSFFTPGATSIGPSLDLRPANTPSWASMTLLPRQAASPVVSGPTTEDDVRTIRRRTRLSFGRLRPSEEQERAPSASGNGATASALSSPAVTAAQNRLLDSTLANRRALARQSSLLEAHAHRTNALSLRGEDLLREAAGVLRRAEDSVSRASNLVQTQAWESRLPSVGALPEPSDPGTQRPVVGIRLGQGWSSETRPANAAAAPEPAPASPTSPTTRRRGAASFFSMSAPSSAPLGSPPPVRTSHEMDDAESSSSASTSAASTRARQFLTSLRARRPRLSRNATAVSPPEGEEQALSPDRDSATYLRSWTLPSPPLANGLAISTFDEEAEVLAAAQLNAHLLDRRQVNDNLDAGLSPPTPPLSSRSLWGEPRANNSQQELLTSRRMRGPTERANERWRRGEPPVSSLASDAGDLARAQQQRAFPTWRTQRTETPRTAISTRRSVLGSPPRLANTADTREADAFMRTRDESPSPRSRRSVRRAASDLFSSRSLNAAEEGTSSSATSNLETDRASIRLPLSSGPPAVSRTNSRVRFEDAEEAPPQGRGWSAPATGPLMLSSGSDGRRMIFPHPAHAAGPSVATVGAAAHDLHLDDFETRHFFEEDDLHPPPFTFDRLARRAPEDRVPAPRMPPRRYPWESGYAAAEAGNFEARPPPQISDDAARSPFRTVSEETLQRDSARRAARSGLSDLWMEARRHSSYASADAEMRQRRTDIAGRTDLNDSAMHAQRAGEATGDEASALLEDRLAQHRQHRVQRLHALRQERNLMRSLLSGTSSEDGPSSSRAFGAPENSNDPTRIGDSNTLRRDGTGPAAHPSRSPGAIWRRRGLGEFLRGFGAGGGRGLISMFDEDFPSFWGRDSAALDPRNYLDDDEFDSSYEALIRLSERLGDARPKGVSPEKLASLPRFQYSIWPMPQRANQVSSSSLESAPMASTSSVPIEQDPPTLARKGLEKEERCGICLCDYSDDDECMLGHCGHGFHEECLTSWLKEKGTCPVCRSDHTKS